MGVTEAHTRPPIIRPKAMDCSVAKGGRRVIRTAEGCEEAARVVRGRVVRVKIPQQNLCEPGCLYGSDGTV